MARRVALPAPATPAWVPSRSARRTSPETVDCGPGCAPVGPVLLLARRGYPDAAVPPVLALCFAAVVRSPAVNPTGPDAGPGCLRKTRSGSQSRPVRDWLPENLSPHPAARSTAPAKSPTPPVASCTGLYPDAGSDPSDPPLVVRPAPAPQSHRQNPAGPGGYDPSATRATPALQPVWFSSRQPAVAESRPRSTAVAIPHNRRTVFPTPARDRLPRLKTLRRVRSVRGPARPSTTRQKQCGAWWPAAHARLRLNRSAARESADLPPSQRTLPLPVRGERQVPLPPRCGRAGRVR